MRTDHLVRHYQNKHKATQHQPDDYYEKPAFNKLLYEKTRRVRGIIDPMIALTIYYPKIKNNILMRKEQ